MRDLAWYEYFFSQCRAMWVYLRMFVLPFGQNVDHDFAISRNLVEHGAVLGLAALIAVSVAAWMYRRRYPVASYGWFVFVILLAPTSSFVPIRDLLVERRLYLPFVGLILICCEFLAKWRTTRMRLAGTLAAVVAVYAVAAYHRNQLWGDAIALWSDTADKSPGKSRPRFQLGYAYYLEGQCAEAAAEYAKAAGIEKPRYDLYVDWALADDCANKPEAALEKLQRAAAIEKTAHVYALIGMVHAKQRRRDEAMAALDQAQQVDPNFQRTYLYRGNLYLLAKEFDKAEEQFRRAIALNPADIEARKGLDMALRRSPVRM
jgi:tetratricopeptide (TPR) repeat protein